jgi:hypothetical protein
MRFFIPNEILFVIFSHLKFGDALIISKICRQWRNVAFAIIKKLPVVIHQNSLCDRSERNPSRSLTISLKFLQNFRIWFSQVTAIDASNANTLCPIPQICLYCPILRYLNLSGLDFLSELKLSEILISCPSIEYLDVSKCFKLSPLSLILISDNLKELKHLNISQTQLASLSSILYLLNSHGSSLVALEMTQAILLGERDWISVLDAVTKCTKIEKIDFSYNCLLTDYALEELTINSRKLELNVKYCDQLSIRAVSDTVKRCDYNLIIHHNARIPDYTPEGIRSYIQYLIGQ